MGILDRFRATPPPEPQGGSGRYHTSGFLDYDEINPSLRGQHGLRLLDKMWRTDVAVRGAIYKIVAPMAGGTWSVEPYGTDQDPTTPEDEEVAQFVEWVLWECMKPKLSTYLWSAMTVVARQGFAPFEQIYKLTQWNGRQVWALKTLDLRLPWSVDRWLQDGPDLVAIEQYAPGYGFPHRSHITVDNLVYHRFGIEGDNWEGQAIIRPAYKHWKYKEGIELVDAIGIERFAVGVPIVYPPVAPTDDDLTAAEAAVEGMRANEAGYIVAPGPKAGQGAPEGQGWLFEILTPQQTTGASRQTADSINYHRSEIDAAVVAEFMRLGQGAVGAKATAEVQQNPFLALVEAIAGMVLEDPINDQVIPRLVALNFDTDRLPKLSCSLIDSTSLEELGSYVAELTDKGLIEPEPTLEAYLRNRADLPPRDEKALAEKAAETAKQAELVAKAAAAQPPPAPAGEAPVAPPADAAQLDAPVTFARQQRELKPWEAFMSLDAIEGAIDQARARLEQACGPAARALAVDLSQQAVAGRQIKPGPPPDELVNAITDELASLYVTGRHTVREELTRQMLGQPAANQAGYTLDAGDGEQADAVAAIVARAKTAAQSVRNAIATSLARAALRRGVSPGVMQATAEQAAMGALRAEATIHAAPALNAGRSAQASADDSMIAGARYTSVLDGNACSPCSEADDDVLRPLDDPVRLEREPPNPECDGGDRCRCMEAFELKGEASPAA